MNKRYLVYIFLGLIFSYSQLLFSQNIELGLPVGHSKPISICEISHNNKIAVSVSQNRILVWDTKNGVLLKKLLGHKDDITDVFFTPDSKSLFSSSKDGIIREWDIESGDLITEIIAPARIKKIKIYFNTNVLVAGLYNGKVVLWDIKNPTFIQEFVSGSDPVLDMFLDSENDNLIVVYPTKISLHKLYKSKFEQEFDFEINKVKHVYSFNQLTDKHAVAASISKDHQLLIIGFSDGSLLHLKNDLKSGFSKEWINDANKNIDSNR